MAYINFRSVLNRPVFSGARHEALRASNTMLIERLVQPVAVGHDVALNEIDVDALPLLTGYVAATPKPAGNVILASESGDPLLATWRFGLGRTAAFTSEPKPRWAEDWIGWDDFAKFWSQLVRSLTAGDLDRKATLECTHALDDAGVTLTAEIHNEMGGFVDATPALSRLGPDGRPQPVPVTHGSPGTFTAHLPEFAFGKDQQFVWRVPLGNAGQKSEPDAADEWTTAYGFVYSFSPEYAAVGPDTAVFDQIRERSVGQVESVGAATLGPVGRPARHWLVLWPYLLAAALLLVPFDILLRRIG